MIPALHVWHLSADAPRHPRRVSAGERVVVKAGTWPIAPGQSVWITWRSAGGESSERILATWERNEGANSYWSATMGPFERGQTIEYTVHASDAGAEVTGPTHRFRVGPKIRLALLWHQHQPMYRVSLPDAEPPPRLPWVRLHALRHYYSMAALVAEYPDIHVTFNLTPVLLAQLDDYMEHGATDRQLDLTLKAAEGLTAVEREEILASFFDADWHRQIFVHPRYRELFDKRVRGEAFTTRDLRDLQMWSSLAWFGTEFRKGPVELVTGERVDVCRFVEQAEGFSAADVGAMVHEQYKVLRAIVPIHRLLQERGQIEVTPSPFYHPVLPLVIDTDQATVDLDGATLPRRFAHPEDADEQVRRAARDYEVRFGRRPRGMWPAEGAVSQSSVPLFARHGVRWIASDRGVLTRSGRWGYEADNPDVLCQPYCVRQDGGELAIFFRDTLLSGAIAFRYQHVSDPREAVSRFMGEIEARLVQRFEHDEDRIVTVIVNGENTWGGYPEDGRPFLRALYERLSSAPEIQTVTFSEYLQGNPDRLVEAHAPAAEVHDLFTGSWIDEARSRPGVDLGTWIGEPAENRAWELLGAARSAIEAVDDARRNRALECVYPAEGSDWFWWLGDDQDSGNDAVFDELYRGHLRTVYRALRTPPPPELDVPLASPRVVWTFARPVPIVVPGDWLVIRTNSPGTLFWRADGLAEDAADLQPVGGVLAGARRFQGLLGKIDPGVRRVEFRFLCREATCAHEDVSCQGAPQTIEVHNSLAHGPGSSTRDGEAP